MITHPGFADPVLDSQACFRAVLDAMSRPGRIRNVTAPEQPPAPLDRATAATLLTLVDLDTPLWLDPMAESAADWIAFHCGAPRADQRDAAFGLALASVPLASFSTGSDDGPENGATLIMQVKSIGQGRPLRLSGPGLAAPERLLIDGLGQTFIAEWATNHARFPRGIDLVLCAGDRLAAFPRTLRIEEG